MRKEQGEAVKTVTQAVVDSLYKPHQCGEAPLALLASDIGCHLVLTGHLDTLVATRLRDGKDVQVARCWTLLYLLEKKGAGVTLSAWPTEYVGAIKIYRPARASSSPATL